MTHSILMVSFAGVHPTFRDDPIARSENAAIIGRVEAGAQLQLGEATLIRADGHFVRIGDDVWLGDYSTVHIAHELYPTTIGDRVTAGRNAVIHACTVGSDCVIHDDVVLLDGTVVGEGVVVAPGSVAYPRSQLLRGGLYAGKPARRVRELEAGEAQLSARAIRNADSIAHRRAAARRRGEIVGGSHFIAPTAQMAGRIMVGSGCSLWFSCDFDAGEGEIDIGNNSNVQDNTFIRCKGEGVRIGTNDRTVAIMSRSKIA